MRAQSSNRKRIRRHRDDERNPEIVQSQDGGLDLLSSEPSVSPRKIGPQPTTLQQDVEDADHLAAGDACILVHIKFSFDVANASGRLWAKEAVGLDRRRVARVNQRLLKQRDGDFVGLALLHRRFVVGRSLLALVGTPEWGPESHVRNPSFVRSSLFTSTDSFDSYDYREKIERVAWICKKRVIIFRRSMDSKTPHPSLPYLWMLCGALAFAAMGALAHGLGPDVDWRVIAIARTGLALVFALALAAAYGVRLVFFRPTTLWLRGIAGSVSLVCTFYALPRLPVGDVLALTNIFPLWIALLSWPVLGVRPSAGVWVAVVSGIAGVWLIQQPHLDAAGPAPVVAVAASFSTCIAMMGLHRLHHIHPLAIVVHFSAVALAFCLAALFFPPVPERYLWSPCGMNLTTLSMLFAVGVSATAGQLFLTRAFASGPPARVSVVALSQVVFGIGFDLWLWQRKLEPITVLGMLLVIGPTAWILLRRRPVMVTEVAGDA